jgi:hypothetical protein
MKRPLPYLTLLISISLVLAACGAVQAPTQAGDNGPVAQISLPQADEVLEIIPNGQKISLRADTASAEAVIEWKLTGNGSLSSKTEPVIQYVAPQSVDADEEVTITVTVTDPRTGRSASDHIVIRLLSSSVTTDRATPLPPTSGPVPPTATSTPTLDSGLTTGTLELDPTKFITQTVPDGEDFFQDIRRDGACVDLRGYILEITFEIASQAGEGKQAQLWFKGAGFRNVYAFPEPIVSGQPMRFDPTVDPLNVSEFNDLSCINAVGAKIWGGTQGLAIAAARLIRP